MNKTIIIIDDQPSVRRLISQYLGPYYNVIELSDANDAISLLDHGHKIDAIRADKTQITQLFQNLMCNGIKYNESSQPTVNIDCCSEGQAVKLSVKDNGIGIPAEYRDKVFNMFQRLPNAQKYPGTGIGLCICKKIVEGMKGKISITEDTTGGTIFNIYLPLSFA